MPWLDTFGGTTRTTLYTASTPLAATAASGAVAMDISRYGGNLTVVLSAQSATGDETLDVELLTQTGATNKSATQMTTRRRFTQIATPGMKAEAIMVPVSDAFRSFIKPRFVGSAASTHRIRIDVYGRIKNQNQP